MPKLSLVHSVRVLAETIQPCTWRDWTGTIEVTLNGGSVWHLPWSWFGLKTDANPDCERIEGLIVKTLEGTLNLANPTAS